MKSILILLGAIAVAVVAYFFIAPREQREAMLDKVVVLGDSSSGEKTPRIVREQQRKERIRQDNSWTPENRALHPIEYCQAQLEEIQRYSNTLEARAHEKGCAIAAVKREIDNTEAMSKAYGKFLAEYELNAPPDGLLHRLPPPLVRHWSPIAPDVPRRPPAEPHAGRRPPHFLA